MKKFSKIFDKKTVPTKNINESVVTNDPLKDKLMQLIDDTLKVRSNGSAHRDLLESSLSIDGKEELANSIINLLETSLEDVKVSTLESLRTSTNDWLLIDEKIKEIKEKNLIKENLMSSKNLVKKIVDVINNYPDFETLKMVCEKTSNKITNLEDAYNRSQIAKNMMIDENYNHLDKYKLKMISDTFMCRYNKIKYGI